MNKRTVPFGYKYENGLIAIDTSPAAIVNEIFGQYLLGKSLLQIADLLNKLCVEYRPGVIGWNKARIKRIIEEKKYTGVGEYPQIISDEIVEKANEIKEQRNKQKNVDKDNMIYQISSSVICPRCKNPMRRYYDPRIRVHERWRCQAPDCKTVIALSDDCMITEITDLLNMLIDHPEIIEQINEPELISMDTYRMRNGINRTLDSRNIDRDDLRTQILEFVSMKYSDLNNNKYLTLKLIDTFSNHCPLNEFSIELFNQTVTTVSFDTDNEVVITLTNNQTIGKERDRGKAEEESHSN